MISLRPECLQLRSALDAATLYDATDTRYALGERVQRRPSARQTADSCRIRLKSIGGNKMADRVKTCFIIAPIGEPNTDLRRRSDQVRRHIIEPVAGEIFKYECLRADDLPQPGLITSQVISHLVEDELVIADLSDWNPNVFYELAIRQAFNKPVVQLLHTGQGLPFDVAQIRTIFYDSQNWDSIAATMGALEKQIQSIERDPTNIESPVSFALNLRTLQQSENPLEKSNAEILTALAGLGNRLQQLEQRLPLYEQAPWVSNVITPGVIQGGLVHGSSRGFYFTTHNVAAEPGTRAIYNIVDEAAGEKFDEASDEKEKKPKGEGKKK
jgi:hypothetical protein